MNITEILKNCPKDMKLYSPVYGEMKFIQIMTSTGNIHCRTSKGDPHYFYPDGKYEREGECVLFPSKEQRDWSKFQIPFKFGDIVAMYNKQYQHTNIGIFNTYTHDDYINVVCTNLADSNEIKIMDKQDGWNKQGVRYATEEEKEFFFNLLKEQNYVWTGKELVNTFDLGDYITNGISVVKITEITDNYYFGYDIKSNAGWSLQLHKIKDWELAKFNICSLKPYDKILIRFEGCWYPSLVSYVDRYEGVYTIDHTNIVEKVIPFEGNEHLIGKHDDPDPYYITWE